MVSPQFDGDSTDSRGDGLRVRAVGTGRACLIRMTGAVGETYLIEPGQELSIGRGQGNDIRLPYTDVSRVHARMKGGKSGKVDLIDLGSTNGTFVNGRKQLYRVLREGDKIQFGETTIFRFAFHDEVDEEFQTRLFGAPFLDRASNTLTRERLVAALREAHARAVQDGKGLAMVVMGIDGMSLVADLLGVAVGDYFLREIAWRIRKGIAGESALYRVGPGAFATILSGATLAQAMSLSERLRNVVANARLPHEGDEMVFSLGVGACTLDEGQLPEGPEEMLTLAEARCRLAADQGGDRVVGSEGAPAGAPAQSD